MGHFWKKSKAFILKEFWLLFWKVEEVLVIRSRGDGKEYWHWFVENLFIFKVFWVTFGKVRAFILKEFSAFILKGRGSPCNQVKVWWTWVLAAVWGSATNACRQRNPHSNQWRNPLNPHLFELRPVKHSLSYRLF